MNEIDIRHCCNFSLFNKIIQGLLKKQPGFTFYVQFIIDFADMEKSQRI